MNRTFRNFNPQLLEGAWFIESGRHMRPFYRENLVNGPYTLERGTLTFRTRGSLLGGDAARALRSGNSLTVCIYTDPGLKEITGRVLSAELKRGTPPTEWDVRMKVQLAKVLK